MSVYKKGENYFVDIHCQGRRIRRRIGPSKVQAQTVHHKLKVEIAQGKFLDVNRDTKTRFSEIAQDFLHYSMNNKDSYVRDVQLYNHLKPRFAERVLAEITPQKLEAYKAERIHEGAKPATINRELAFGKATFNWASKNDKASSNPF